MQFYVGPHIKYGKSLMDGIRDGVERGANCFQFFLTSPRRKLHKVAKEKIDAMEEIKKYVSEKNIKLYIHSPYTLNFAKESISGDSWWIQSMISELVYANQLGVTACVLHMGKALELPRSTAYKNMLYNIKCVLKKTKDIPVKILLETSAGQGTELGYRLDDLATFWNQFAEKYKKRLGICLDTCHTFVAGYDWRSKGVVIKNYAKLEELLGKDTIQLIHLNDSAIDLGGRVDRHARVGKGKIGSGLKYIVRIAYKRKIPIILETPNENLRDDLVTVHKWAHLK